MTLNMDLGTLRFSRNGRDLGVAVQGLEGTLYPAFSMYNRYVPKSSRATAKHTLSAYVHVLEPHRDMSSSPDRGRWVPTTVEAVL